MFLLHNVYHRLPTLLLAAKVTVCHVVTGVTKQEQYYTVYSVQLYSPGFLKFVILHDKINQHNECLKGPQVNTASM